MTTVDPKLLTQISYRCIGPTRGGRAVAVAADPTDQAVFYHGAVAGGVWKTNDAGLYWENVSDGFMKSGSVGALRVAPSDGNVIYAGMGEATIRIDVTHGDGMYRSTDAGRSWAHIGLDDSRHIGELVVHPTDPDTVYVAVLGHAFKDSAERGLYRSTDGGQNWERVLYVSDRAGAIDVTIDPNNPRILMASMWQTRRTFWSIDSGGPDCGLWRSFDGGDTWESMTGTTTGEGDDATTTGRFKGLPDGTLGKIGVSLSPARSGRAWAIIEAEGRKRGLYRTDDHGDTWEKVCSQPDLSWRPWYYMHVEAHPTEADTVFIMNQKTWKSIDGGKNFNEFVTPHGDNHAIWVDPINPDRIVGCDDGGAWVSLNAGESWSSIYNQLTAQFYHVAVDDQYPYMVYGTQQDNSSIAVPSSTGRGAINWGDCYPPGTGESGYIAPKPGDPDVVWIGAIGSSPGGGEALQRYDRRTNQVQLVNVWPEAYNDGNSAEVRFQWTYPIVFAPQDSDTLYVCGNKVFRTRDEGMSWETISDDLTYADPDTMGGSGPLTIDTAGAEMYATIFSFLASAHQAGTLMAGSDDGLVHVSHDDGGTWTNVTPPQVEKFSQVTSLVESPHNNGVVYMTVARHKMGDYVPYVYKTADWGSTWERIDRAGSDTGIPDGEFCRIIREDPNREGLLYVGTEMGIHVSFDGGDNWQSLQANLPPTPVYDMVVKDTDLVVATHGRSFWILDDLTQLHQLAEEPTEIASAKGVVFAPRDTVRTPPDLFADFWGSQGGKNYHVTIGQNATFYLEEAETGHKTKRVLDAGTDLIPGARVTYWLGSKPTEPITLSFFDTDGNEVNSYTSDIPEDKEDRSGLYCTADEGMNSFQWNMRHAQGPKMMGAKNHGPSKGPLVVPGEYEVRLTIGGDTTSARFSLLRHPAVATSDADFAEQQDLLVRIQSKLNDAVEAINRIRRMTAQLTELGERDGTDDDTSEQAKAVIERLAAIEDELVQKEFTSPGDRLHYPLCLFEKLNELVAVVDCSDNRPTAQSYEVLDKLGGLIDEQISALDTVVDTDVAAFNSTLAGAEVAPIGT